MAWLLRCLLAASLHRMAAGHGALVSPVPRNAFDRQLPRFAGGRGSECNCGDVVAGCAVGARAGMNGQSCFWFSQGCFIGCAACTGTNIEPDGMSRANESGSVARTCARGYPPAGASFEPTLPRRLWTMNLQHAANETGADDVFQYHPWRAPGSAPVADACGVAGGTSSEYEGPGNAFFSNVSAPGPNGTRVVAAMGDRGSAVLAPGAAAATWAAGSSVEVKWGLRFNHGGGYQYRLCPADQPLTEDCFMRGALDFVRGSQALEWKNGTRAAVSEPQYIDEGVIPVGGTWARNPIPVIQGKHAGCGAAAGAGAGAANATDAAGMLCRQFEPPCAGDNGWGVTPGATDATDVMGACSGSWVDGVVVDRLAVPTTLAPGLYVLGFRWDAEQTSQVWSSCADVEIV